MDRRPLVQWNKILVVGESPGREEVRRGVPFIGPSGQLLRKVLESLGENMDQLHVTNAIRCNFTSGKKPSDTDVEKARQCCSWELEANIIDLQPKVILALGGVALTSTTGLKGAEKYRGATTQQTYGEDMTEQWGPTVPALPIKAIVVSTIHPAALLRSPEKHAWLDLFAEDIRRAFLLAGGRINIFHPEVLPFDFEVLMRDILIPGSVISCDLETNGIDIRECGITTVGLSRLAYDEKTGEERTVTMSIPCPGLRPKFKTAQWEKAWKELKAAFGSPAFNWVFHNMAFDVPIIERIFGLKIVGQISDTLLMHHALYPKVPHDLQAVSTQFFAVEPWKAYYEKRFIDVADDLIPALLYYNGADTAMTAQLNDKLRSELRRDNLMTVYQNDRIVTSYAMDWEKIGIGIDEEVRSNLHYSFSTKVEALRDQLCEMAEDDTFNPNSPQQLQKILVNKFHLIPKKITQSGQLSTDATALFEFRDHPFVELLQKYRTDSKLFSTYIDGLGKKVGSDGRIHPRWNKTATPSGRFGTKPAVQNWPDEMREMLIPAPGRVIISADFAALELRISVLLAGQEDLIEAFINNTDVHAMFAETYFEEIWHGAEAGQHKILRKNSKPITFGDIYRAGAQTLYENVRESVPGITFKEVELMQARKRAKYTNVNEYAAYITAQANKDYELRTPWLGRMRRWPLGGVADTEATNHPIQGGAADIVDAATIRWHELLIRKGDYHKRVWPIMQIHDDLRAEVVRGYELEALKDLVDCMRCSKKLVSPITGKSYEMPFEVEGKIGPNHRDLKEVTA